MPRWPTMGNLPNDIDPLTLALQPPPDETIQQKVERLRVEEEARRISHLIDEQIKVDRAQMKKAASAHKILLLGTLQQSLFQKIFDTSFPDRSGRVRQEHNPQESVYIYSAENAKVLITAVADFQMIFAPKAFAQECKRWKPLIQLNLIRSVLVILDNLVVDPSLSDLDVDNYLSLDLTMGNALHSRGHHLLGAKVRALPENDLSGVGVPNSYPGSSPMPQLTRQHEYLKMRLSPLARLQELLISRLAADFGDAISSRANAKLATTKGGEFFVRAKVLLGRRNSSDTTRSRSSKHFEDDGEITNVLDACRDDMVALWQDPIVREILHRRDIHLEEGPGL